MKNSSFLSTRVPSEVQLYPTENLNNERSICQFMGYGFTMLSANQTEISRSQIVGPILSVFFYFQGEKRRDGALREMLSRTSALLHFNRFPPFHARFKTKELTVCKEKVRPAGYITLEVCLDSQHQQNTTATITITRTPPTTTNNDNRGV